MAFRLAGFLTMLGAVLLAGCQEPTAPDTPVLAEGDGHGHGHDHGHEHGHPETFAAAFAELEELNTEIAKGFEANDPDAAHGPLHEIGDVLGHLAEFAEDLHLEDDAKAEVVAAIGTLKDSFKAVDKKLHDQEGAKDYSEVKDDISQAIQTIETKAAEHLQEAHGDHDHDHDGHDEHGEVEHGEVEHGEVEHGEVEHGEVEHGEDHDDDTEQAEASAK